ncbi:hypothetical protein OG984_09635 [Nocardioides sp. NBC_00368]|uniref:hypothetical protein n=1 Tax=Nocardioides sp. NBC_00368 TaxID=2976000 RepID=UPI002E21681E
MTRIFFLLYGLLSAAALLYIGIIDPAFVHRLDPRASGILGLQALGSVLVSSAGLWTLARYDAGLDRSRRDTIAFYAGVCLVVGPIIFLVLDHYV